MPHICRALSVPAAAVSLLLLAAVPLLFDEPPSTIRDRGTLLRLACTISEADPMRRGWTVESLDSAAAELCPGLSLAPALEDSLAVAVHTLYPFRFLTVRGRSRITVALAPPWPDLPARRYPPGLSGSGPRRSGGCLVYVLREKA